MERPEILRKKFSLNIFKRDNNNWQGIPKINIYFLRAMFILMVVFLGKDSWGHILAFEGSWNPMEAMAWSVWASFSLLAVLGVLYPLKMLPLIMLEIIYKVVWLILVAYPLWSTGQLAGSDSEGMTKAFLWVVLPIMVMPWRYFFKKYILGESQVR